MTAKDDVTIRHESIVYKPGKKPKEQGSSATAKPKRKRKKSQGWVDPTTTMRDPARLDR